MRTPIFNFHSLSHQILTIPKDLKWSLKEKIVHWNIANQHCEFPRESDILQQATNYTSSTSNCVHFDKSLQQKYQNIVNIKNRVKKFCQGESAVQEDTTANSAYGRRTNLYRKTDYQISIDHEEEP